MKSLIARRRLLTLGTLAALPWLSVPGRAQRLNPFIGITSVEVFCNSAMLVEPLANPPFRQAIYRMDALEQTLRSINAHVPHDENAARRWLAANQKQIKRLVMAPGLAVANAINRANYYRIDRLPAIVINSRGVIYGVTDVADAVARYQAHIQGRR